MGWTVLPCPAHRLSFPPHRWMLQESSWPWVNQTATRVSSSLSPRPLPRGHQRNGTPPKKVLVPLCPPAMPPPGFRSVSEVWCPFRTRDTAGKPCLGTMWPLLTKIKDNTKVVGSHVCPWGMQPEPGTHFGNETPVEGFFHGFTHYFRTGRTALEWSHISREVGREDPGCRHLRRTI